MLSLTLGVDAGQKPTKGYVAQGSAQASKPARALPLFAAVTWCVYLIWFTLNEIFPRTRHDIKMREERGVPGLSGALDPHRSSPPVFRSLQSDVMLQAMSSRFDIIAAVKKCFDEYDGDRMESVWRSLITSYRGCLETGGDNNYKTHRSVAKGKRQGLDMDVEIDYHVVKQAQAALAKLQAEEAAEAGGLGGAVAEDESSSDSEQEERALDFDYSEDESD